MFDRGYLQELINTSGMAERKDGFEKTLEDDFSYYDLKIAKDKVDLQFEKKNILKIRFIVQEKNEFAVLYFKFDDKTSLVKTVKPEAISLWLKLLDGTGIKRKIIYAKMNKSALSWRTESMKEVYQRTKDAYATYEVLHAQIISAVAIIAKENNFSKMNIVDGGCGDGALLKKLENQLAEDKSVKMNMLGFDYNAQNIRDCSDKYHGQAHFFQGSLNQLSQHLQKSRQEKKLDESSPTVLILSGSLTRAVLNDGFEALKILQNAVLNQVDFVIGGAHHLLLLNVSIARRVGFKKMKISEVKEHELGQFFSYQRLSQNEIRQNKMAKMINRRFLDLSLCPNPEELLSHFDELGFFNEELTIDLSFCQLTDELLMKLLLIGKDATKVKLIFWHQNEFLITKFVETLKNGFQFIDVKLVTKDSYLMAPRGFYLAMHPGLKLFSTPEVKSEVKLMHHELEKIIKCEDLESIQKISNKEKAMQLACEDGNVEVIVFLLQLDVKLIEAAKFSDNNLDCYFSVLDHILKTKNMKLISDLISKYPSYCFQGHKLYFKLLEEKVDFSQIKDSAGNTFLHHCAEGGMSPDIIKDLVDQYGLDVNAKNFQGQVPLHVARIFLVEYFVKDAKAELKIVDEQGGSVLHSLAAKVDRYYFEEYAKYEKNLLLAVNKDGDTPFHIAAKNCKEYLVSHFEKIIRLYFKIYKKGIFHVKNNSGKSVVDLCIEQACYQPLTCMHALGIDVMSALTAEKIKELQAADKHNFLVGVFAKNKPKVLAENKSEDSILSQALKSKGAHKTPYLLLDENWTLLFAKLADGRSFLQHMPCGEVYELEWCIIPGFKKKSVEEKLLLQQKIRQLKNELNASQSQVKLFSETKKSDEDVRIIKLLDNVMDSLKVDESCRCVMM